MPNVDSGELRNLVVGYKNYGKMRSKIQEVIEKLKPHKVEADLRWIYSGNNGEIDSISLQAIPRQDSRFIGELKKIEDETRKYTNKLPWPSLRVKAKPKHCPVAFTMNTLRFIKNTENKESKLLEGNANKLIECIEKINKEHNKEPLHKINIEKITLYEVNDAFFHKRQWIRDFF